MGTARERGERKYGVSLRALHKGKSVINISPREQSLWILGVVQINIRKRSLWTVRWMDVCVSRCLLWAEFFIYLYFQLIFRICNSC